jgi:hypothetical protein
VQESTHYDLRRALDEVSASSSGGAPFLIAYGLTFIATGVLSYFADRTLVALVAMFQGTVALPLAFLLERRMGTTRMSPDNPLKDLSAKLAMSQSLAIPGLIIVFHLNAGAIPVVLASLAGVHFFAYAWLQRTRIYTILGSIIALGAFAMQMVMGSDAFSAILFFIGICYWIAAPLLRRHAARLVATG